MASIISVASGKGGVGKSFFSSNLAMSINHNGGRVLLVDADLGGANLHNFVGVEMSDSGMYNFLREKEDINDVIRRTPAGVDFLSGSGDILGMAHITKFEKGKIIRNLKELSYEYIVLDLGAGTSFNMVDLFNLADKRVLVLTTEPTSVESAYGFAKIAVYRYVERLLSRDHRFDTICRRLRNKGRSFADVRSICESVLKIDEEACAKIATFIKNYKIGIVANMITKKSDLSIFHGFDAVVGKYLSVDVASLGFLPHEAEIVEHIKLIKPYYTSNEGSPINECIDDVLGNVLKKL